MPVADVRCKYLKPARYDDLLDIMTRIEELGFSSVRFSYRVLRRAGGELLATGETRHASLGREGRARRIPEEVRKCLLG